MSIVSIAGGTGFVGSNLLRHLRKEGYRIRVLTENRKEKNTRVEDIEYYPVDFKNEESVSEGLNDSHIFINLIGIIGERKGRTFEESHILIPEILSKSAKNKGIDLFIHMSALGAGKESKSRYRISKAIGEEKVRANFPDATILRPSVIIGRENKFFEWVAKISKFSPFILLPQPYFKMSPVWIGDVCEGIGRIIKGRVKGRIVEMCGSSIITNRELFNLALKIKKIKRITVPFPLSLAKVLLKMAELIIPRFPFSSDALIQMEEGANICHDKNTFRELLGRNPLSIEEMMRIIEGENLN